MSVVAPIATFPGIIPKGREGPDSDIGRRLTLPITKVRQGGNKQVDLPSCLPRLRLRGANSFGLAWQARLQQPIAHMFRIRRLSVMKRF